MRGTMRFVLDLRPGFDYACAPHTVRVTPDGANFTPQDAAHGDLTLHVVGAADSPFEEQGIKIEQHGTGLRAVRTLSAGQTWGVILESNGGAPRRRRLDEARLRLVTACAISL